MSAAARRRTSFERASNDVPPPATWDFLFVDCPICERSISDEMQHKCKLSWAQQHARDTARAAKITELTYARQQWEAQQRRGGR